MSTTEKPSVDNPSHADTLNEEYLNSLSPEERGFVERTLDIYKDVAQDTTIGDRLNKYYESGDEKGFADSLEEVIYDLMEEDPYYQKLIGEVRDARRYNKSHQEQTDAINALDANYRKLVLSLTGLPDPETMNGLYDAQQSVAVLLKEKLGNDINNKPKVEEALGIRVLNPETNKFEYRFPEEMMPDSVNKLWHTYLASVGDYEGAYRELWDSGDLTQQAVIEEIERRRIKIHDKLTKDFQKVIGLSDESGWDFDSTRELIATIRDHEFSHYGAIPKNREDEVRIAHQTTKMNKIVRDNGDGLTVLKKIASKK